MDNVHRRVMEKKDSPPRPVLLILVGMIGVAPQIPIVSTIRNTVHKERV